MATSSSPLPPLAPGLPLIGSVMALANDAQDFFYTQYRKLGGVFAPFGAGPHTCLGAGLAEVQVMLVIATMLHYIDFSMDPVNYRLKKAYTPSMTPKDFGFKITTWRH